MANMSIIVANDTAASTAGVAAPSPEVHCGPSSEVGVETTGVLPAIQEGTNKRKIK